MAEEPEGKAILLSEDQLSTLRVCFTQSSDWKPVALVLGSSVYATQFSPFTDIIPRLRCATSITNALSGEFFCPFDDSPESLHEAKTRPLGLIFYVTKLPERDPTSYVIPDEGGVPYWRGRRPWVLQCTVSQFHSIIVACQRLIQQLQQQDTLTQLPEMQGSVVRVCLRKHDMHAAVWSDMLSRDVDTMMPVPQKPYALIISAQCNQTKYELAWPFGPAQPSLSDKATWLRLGGLAYTILTPQESQLDQRMRDFYRALVQYSKRNEVSRAIESTEKMPYENAGSVSPGLREDLQIFGAATRMTVCAQSDALSELSQAGHGRNELQTRQTSISSAAHLALRFQHSALRAMLHSLPTENLTGRPCMDASCGWAYVCDTLGEYTVSAHSVGPVHLPVIQLPLPRFVYDSNAAGVSQWPDPAMVPANNYRNGCAIRPRYFGPCFLSGRQLHEVCQALADPHSSLSGLNPQSRFPQQLPIAPQPITHGDQRKPSSGILGHRRLQCVNGLDAAFDTALRSVRLGPSYHQRRALFSSSVRQASRMYHVASPTHSSPPSMQYVYVTDMAARLGYASKEQAIQEAAKLKRGMEAVIDPVHAEPTVPVPHSPADVFERLIHHPHIAEREKALLVEMISWRRRQAQAFTALAVWICRLNIGSMLASSPQPSPILLRAATIASDRGFRGLQSPDGPSYSPALPEHTLSAPMADVFQAVMAQARELSDAVPVSALTQVQAVAELRAQADALGLPPSARVPERSLFAGFDCLNIDPTATPTAVLMSTPYAAVRAGFAFAEMWRRMAEFEELVNLRSAELTQERLLEILKRQRGPYEDPTLEPAETVLPALVLAMHDWQSIRTTIPAVKRKEAAQFYEPGLNDGSWMRMGQSQHGSDIFQDSCMFLAATGAHVAEQMLHSIPNELQGLSPAVARGVLRQVLSSPTNASQVSQIRSGSFCALRCGSFGEIFSQCLSAHGSLLDQSFGELFATDIFPHRFIGPARFIGSGSFANCFLFFDLANGGAVASKQSTRQWKRVHETQRPVPGAWLLGLPGPMQTVVSCASPYLARQPPAMSPWQSRSGVISERYAQSPPRPPDDTVPAEVRLFDYTLREAVNLARCAGRICCTTVIGEYLTVYTCSHTLMLHFIPTQRLPVMLGRVGAAELQSYLRDILIGLAASHNAAYRLPPGLMELQPPFIKALYERSDPASAAVPDQDVYHCGFLASELAGLASTEDAIAIRRFASDSLIHRDIKPANFLWHPPHLLSDGTVKFEAGILIDYGLSVVENGAETIKAYTGSASDQRRQLLAAVEAAREAPNSLSSASPTQLLEMQRNTLIAEPKSVETTPVFMSRFTPQYVAQQPCQAAHFVSARAGTRGYRAPEMLMGLPHTPASDIWSVGSIFLGLLLAQTDLFAPPRPEYVHGIDHNRQSADFYPPAGQVDPARPSSSCAICAVEQRTGQVLYELMAIRSLVGAEAFVRICAHSGVDIVHSYAGAPPAMTTEVLMQMVRGRQPALYEELTGSMRDRLLAVGADPSDPRFAGVELSDIFALVLRMLSPLPADRPSAEELLEHPWFSIPFVYPQANSYVPQQTVYTVEEESTTCCGPKGLGPAEPSGIAGPPEAGDARALFSYYH